MEPTPEKVRELLTASYNIAEALGELIKINRRFYNDFEAWVEKHHELVNK